MWQKIHSVSSWASLMQPTSAALRSPCDPVEGYSDYHGLAEGLTGVLLVVDGLAQIAGLTLLTIGASVTSTQVVRDDGAAQESSHVSLSAGPGTLQLSYHF